MLIGPQPAAPPPQAPAAPAAQEVASEAIIPQPQPPATVAARQEAYRTRQPTAAETEESNDWALDMRQKNYSIVQFPLLYENPDSAVLTVRALEPLSFTSLVVPHNGIILRNHQGATAKFEYSEIILGNRSYFVVLAADEQLTVKYKERDNALLNVVAFRDRDEDEEYDLE